MKYNVVRTYGGTYGDGAAYKIYSTEEKNGEWVVEKPIVGIYFSFKKGKALNKENNFDTYEEAADFVRKDSIESVFNGRGLHPRFKQLSRKL